MSHDSYDWGLVNKVVAADELMVHAIEMAGAFAKGPTLAFGACKRLLQTAYAATLETQLDAESRSIVNMMRTLDGGHGLESFLHKRKPIFHGR